MRSWSWIRFLSEAPVNSISASGSSPRKRRFFIDRIPDVRFTRLTLVAFEVLDFTLMPLGGGAASEGAEIAALACFWIDSARIDPIFSRFEFANHAALHFNSDVNEAGHASSSRRELLVGQIL